VTQWVQAKLAR